MKTNTAASGAYIVESHKPGESTVLRRNEKWVGGAGRRAAVLQAHHHPDRARARHARQPGRARRCRPLHRPRRPPTCRPSRSRPRPSWSSIPQTNGFTHVSMNTQHGAVRQRQGAPGGRRGAALRRHVQGGDLRPRPQALSARTWTTAPPDASFPQADSQQDRPGAGQEAAGRGGPSQRLLDHLRLQRRRRPRRPSRWRRWSRRSLGKIGIQVEIQKKPDAEFNTLAVRAARCRSSPTARRPGCPTPTTSSTSTSRATQRWNFAGWKSTKMEELTLDARYQTDKAKYEDGCKQMIELCRRRGRRWSCCGSPTTTR